MLAASRAGADARPVASVSCFRSNVSPRTGRERRCARVTRARGARGACDARCRIRGSTRVLPPRWPRPFAPSATPEVSQSLPFVDFVVARSGSGHPMTCIQGCGNSLPLTTPARCSGWRRGLPDAGGRLRGTALVPESRGVPHRTAKAACKVLPFARPAALALRPTQVSWLDRPADGSRRKRSASHSAWTFSRRHSASWLAWRTRPPDLASRSGVSRGRHGQTSEGLAGLQRQGEHMKGTHDCMRPNRVPQKADILREP